MKEETYTGEDLDIREHEIENVLGRTPGGLLRVGITVLFAVFAVLLVGSAFFSYPDMLTAKVVIAAEHAPLPLVCAAGGKIMDLPVEDNQTVEAGALVAVLENAARTEDVLDLKSGLERGEDEHLAETERDWRLGNIHAAFTTWKYAMAAYRNFRVLRYHERSIASLERQLSYLEEFIVYNERQGDYLEQQLALERKQFGADSVLASLHIIAEADLDASRLKLLQQESGAESGKAALTESRMRVAELQQQILNLRLDYEQQRQELQNQIRQSRELLDAAIKEWEQLYAVRAPSDGRVSYSRYWVEGEYAAAGETLFMLLAGEGGGFEGRIELPMAKSGKVEPGQRVHIKLDNYPYMEYGILEGTVRGISATSNKDMYRVDVELSNGLETSYKRQLAFLQGMSGTADIITEEQSLLQRLLFPLKSLRKMERKEEGQ